jgi:hypothetical protein
VGPEESSVNTAYLPQVRVSCGDLSDYKGAIDRLKDWEPNVTHHTLVTQGYVMMACYSANDVETRDLADHLKNVILRARKDLGKRGIFGLRDLSSMKPKGVDAGSHQDGIYLSRVSFAFMVVENSEHRNVDDPFLRNLGLDTRPEDTKFDTTRVEKVFPYNHEPLIELMFDDQVGPEYPEGVSVLVNGDEVGHTAVRHPFNYRRLRVELDDAPPLSSAVTLLYEPGNLRGEGPLPPFRVDLGDGTVTYL